MHNPNAENQPQAFPADETVSSRDVSGEAAGVGIFSKAARVLILPSKAVRWLYEWTIRWAGTRQAPWALFLVATAESSVFPIPPDALLIPMVLSRLEAWIRIASICTIGSVLGALIGYAIGWAFYESVGRYIVDAYNLHQAMEAIGDSYSRHAFVTVLTAAFTPIPYKVITIGAGLYKISLPTLIVASLIGRAGRFFLVAGLLRMFGERIARFIEKYFDALALAFALLLIGGFLVIKYLM